MRLFLISFFLLISLPISFCFSADYACITGHIKDSITKKPLASITVNIVCGSFKKTVITDSSGFYQFSQIPLSQKKPRILNSAAVSAIDQNYKTKTLTIFLKPNTNYTLDFTLNAKFNYPIIKGKVIDSKTFLKIGGATITAKNTTNPADIFSTTTDAAGSYLLKVENKKTANYSITACAQGYQTSPIKNLKVSPATTYSVNFNLNDNVAPVITFDPVISPTNLNQQTIQGKYQERNIKLIKVNNLTAQLNQTNQTFSARINLTEGDNPIIINAWDFAGNTASLTTIVILDTTAPKFSLNPLIKFNNTPIQVLAGTKDPDSSILINNTEVIPLNKHTSWYYELPTTNNIASITASDNLNNKSPVKNINLTDTTIAVDPPYICGIQIDQQTKDIILSISDPQRVLSYNIYYANNLASGNFDPFILAQSDFPVSGNGITQWRDNGTYTGVHPADPSVRMRFYRLEVNQVAPILVTINPVTSPTDQLYQTITGTYNADSINSITVNNLFADIDAINKTYYCQIPLKAGDNPITVIGTNNLNQTSQASALIIRNQTNPQINMLPLPCSFYGTINIPAESLIIAKDPDQVIVGKAVVSDKQTYQLIANPDDPVTEKSIKDEGATNSDLITFYCKSPTDTDWTSLTNQGTWQSGNMTELNLIYEQKS